MVEPDKLKRLAERTWNKLSPEVKDEYGQEYFETGKNISLQRFRMNCLEDIQLLIVDCKLYFVYNSS